MWFIKAKKGNHTVEGRQGSKPRNQSKEKHPNKSEGQIQNRVQISGGKAKGISLILKTQTKKATDLNTHKEGAVTRRRCDRSDNQERKEARREEKRKKDTTGENYKGEQEETQEITMHCKKYTQEIRNTV